MLFSLAADPVGHYVHWGVVLISVTNLAIVGAMVVVFALAIALPFPGATRRPGSGSRS
ncbi:hypothetical protein [Angustibacter sp. Root456]|uniref:hypothetical protein n=1 Tax=Angustibacter sp. Root456 TaxID=1736539 RepID=UPI0012FCB93C|nr:hypothetical protein [Angustibacter sp. Root456]